MLRNPLQRVGGRDDGNALVALDVAQAPVAGDDEISVCGERAGDHGVIVAVSKHDAPRLSGRHDLRKFLVVLEEFSTGQAGGANGFRELAPRQNLIELIEQDPAGKELQLVLFRRLE